MKLLKKPALYIMAGITLLLASCNGTGSLSSSAALPMDGTKAIQQIQDAYKQIDGNEYKVVWAHWIEKDKMSNDADFVSFTMVRADGSAYNQPFVLQGPAKGPATISSTKNRNYNYEDVDALTAADFDPATILKYYEDAKTQIPEGYTYRGVSSHNLQVNGKTNKKENTFKLMVTEDGKEEVKSAGQTVIEYYELDFVVEEDGSVVLKD